MAYSVDFSGDEVYDVRVVDIKTGTLVEDTVKEVLFRVAASVT